MVYRNKKKNYRRKRRAVGFLDRKYSVKDLAWKAFKGVRYIKGLVNAEKMYLDTTNTAVSVTASGVVTQLNAIAQGDTTSSRTGNSVLMKNLFGRMVVVADASEANNSWVRIMIVKDKQQVGDTDPGVTSILATSTPLSPLNRNTAGRFQILYDKLINLSVLQGATIRTLKMNIPINCHARYNGTASSDIQKNGIYLVLVGNEVTTTPDCEYYFRLNYYDN